MAVRPISRLLEVGRFDELEWMEGVRVMGCMICGAGPEEVSGFPLVLCEAHMGIAVIGGRVEEGEISDWDVASHVEMMIGPVSPLSPSSGSGDSASASTNGASASWRRQLSDLL